MSDAPRKTGDFKFPAGLRLGRRREFERAFAAGRRAADGRLTIWIVPNELEHSRLGLIVGRRQGNAVRRNRIRRILREAFRLSRQHLPVGLDILCSPRAGADINLAGCVESLTRLAARLEQHPANRNVPAVKPKARGGIK